MAIDQRLTIVLVLKGRVPFTFRWLRYSNNVHLPYRILIADGGEDCRLEKPLHDKQWYPQLDYDYIRYPFDATYAEYYEKMVDALSRVNTPFVAMADNDDFFIPDGLRKSVDFLSRNPDYSSCSGTIAGIRIQPDSSLGNLSEVYGRKIDFCRSIYPPGAAIDDTAAQRVQRQFSTYRANWYDVFRAGQALENFRALRDLNPKDLILAQHIPMLLGYVAGKVHRGPFLYLIRQMQGPGSSHRTEIAQKGDHFDRMLLESWSRDFTGFLKVITEAISLKDGINMDVARIVVKQGYRTFMGPGVVACLNEQSHSSGVRHFAEWLASSSGVFAKLARRLIAVMRFFRHMTKAFAFLPTYKKVCNIASLPKEMEHVISILRSPDSGDARFLVDD
jgi:glycosyltransferase domain-containing protein